MEALAVGFNTSNLTPAEGLWWGETRNLIAQYVGGGSLAGVGVTVGVLQLAKRPPSLAVRILLTATTGLLGGTDYY
jgi:hypothetical protein